MKIEEINQISYLYDFYKNLLTSKQQEVIKLYVFDNLSFSEIAEQFKVSRQAVKDLLDRSIETLNMYEQKLNLYSKYTQSKQLLDGENLRRYTEIWEGN